MGLELAELQLLSALRALATDSSLDVRVVGGRSARSYARRLDARWIPAKSHTLPRFASLGADLVHLIGLDLPPPRRKPFIATVHDLCVFHFDDEGVAPPWLEEIVQGASLLLSPSAFTAAELNRQLGVPPERVRVFGGAAVLDAQKTDPLSSVELREFGIAPPFVLRYGGYTKRKNVPLLLEAWARVETATLVLAGPAQPARTKILSGAPSLDRVVVLDYVPQAVLARLLRSAAAFVTTSEYEGFGLPALEALAAGTPVVAVSKPFVREVCGDAALLVDDSPEAVADALHRILVDRELARRLRAIGPLRAANFSWDSAAAAVVRAYASASMST